MRDLKADMETCKNATPGPWMASIDHEVEDYRVCQDNGDGECICCLAMMGNWDQETQEWTGESKTSFAADTRFIAAAREGWPHAIERAITAEAEVERLTALLETHASTCVVCDYASKIAELQAENAKLREVAEAAREFLDPCFDDGDDEKVLCDGLYSCCGKCPALRLKRALAELAISKTETTTKEEP